MAARDGKRAARRPSQGREVLARIVELLLDTAVFVLAAFGLVGVAVVALEARGAPPAQTVFNLLIVCAVDRKSTRLNSSHVKISYAVFCLKKKRCMPCHGAPGVERPLVPRAMLPEPPPLVRQ